MNERALLMNSGSHLEKAGETGTRKIDLRLSKEDLGDSIAKIALMTAIGRLCLWGLKYQKVIIAIDKEGHDGTPPDLIATYWLDESADKPSFVMGAIWDTKGSNYTYHS